MQVWEYTLVGQRTELDVPIGARFLDVQIVTEDGQKYGRPRVWAMVDPGKDRERITILTFYNGQDIPENVEYLGTFDLLGWINHAYICYDNHPY